MKYYGVRLLRHRFLKWMWGIRQYTDIQQYRETEKYDRACRQTYGHRWELLGSYPVLTVVMLIYH